MDQDFELLTHLHQAHGFLYMMAESWPSATASSINSYPSSTSFQAIAAHLQLPSMPPQLHRNHELLGKATTTVCRLLTKSHWMTGSIEQA